MKRVVAVLFCILFLTGCSNSQLDEGLLFRERLLSAEGCTFRCQITADYGEELYTFDMDCVFDSQGNLSFAVMSPETIAGITGRISEEGGKLTFDDKVLAFSMLADGQFSPVSSPWILMRTLRSGYIHSAAQSQDGVKLCIDDSYEDDALQIDVWLDSSNLPEQAQILWQNRRILSMCITNFAFV